MGKGNRNRVNRTNKPTNFEKVRENQNEGMSFIENIIRQHKDDLTEFYTKYIDIFVDGHQWSNMYLQRSTEKKKYWINKKLDRDGFVEIFVCALLSEHYEFLKHDVQDIPQNKTPLHYQLFTGLNSMGYNTDEIMRGCPHLVVLA